MHEVPDVGTSITLSYLEISMESQYDPAVTTKEISETGKEESF